jgi:hypothetical protein
VIPIDTPMVCLPRRFDSTRRVEKGINGLPAFVVPYLSILGALFLPPFNHGHGNFALRLEKGSRAGKSSNHGDTL